VDPAGEWVLTGLAEALLETGLDVVLLLEALYVDPGVGDPPVLALLLGEHGGDVAMEVLVDRGLDAGLVLAPGGHGDRIDTASWHRRLDGNGTLE
jgi:hypothetical protein